jgi:hypothetical protein
MSNMENRYQLEARVNVEGEKCACAICSRWVERKAGETETYLVGTHSWVCPVCAYRIDRDLAIFAYWPEMMPPTPPGEPHPDHFEDGCPVCGSAGAVTELTVRETLWKLCERHGLRWSRVDDMSDRWEEETETDWERNEAVLLRCRKIEAYHPRLPWRARVQRSLRWNLHKAPDRIRRPTVGPREVESDEAPF